MNAKIDISGVTLKTERLTLRSWTLADLDDFYEYAKVDGVGQLAGWLPHENKEKSLTILNNFIQEKKTFAIIFNETGKVVGSIGIEEYGMEDILSEFFDYSGRELGFVLSKNYWGRGIMTEAVKKVIDYLFNDLNLDFITCCHFDYNTRSKRVQYKCGFKPYRKIVTNTETGTKENSTLNLLTNPNKTISLTFSHPETLIYEK